MGRYEDDFKGKRSFVNRNLVAIVMVPSLIALHYGWSLLQQNDALVKKEERIDLPIVTVRIRIWACNPSFVSMIFSLQAARHLWRKLQGSSGDDASK